MITCEESCGKRWLLGSQSPGLQDALTRTLGNLISVKRGAAREISDTFSKGIQEYSILKVFIYTIFLRLETHFQEIWNLSASHHPPISTRK